MVAIHDVHYNYARIHKTLRITPNMAAGLSDHVWSLEEIVLMADSYMPKLGKRGPLTGNGHDKSDGVALVFLAVFVLALGLAEGQALWLPQE